MVAHVICWRRLLRRRLRAPERHGQLVFLEVMSFGAFHESLVAAPAMRR